MTRTAKVSLDQMDHDIIRLLTGRGRMSNVQIAALLDCSEGTVRRRRRALIGSGLIRPTVEVDHAKLSPNGGIAYIRIHSFDPTPEFHGLLAPDVTVLEVMRIAGTRATHQLKVRAQQIADVQRAIGRLHATGATVIDFALADEVRA